jgi:hypothetical protein
MLFHSPQPSQRPDHFEKPAPQAEQEKVFDFAIGLFCLMFRVCSRGLQAQKARAPAPLASSAAAEPAAGLGIAPLARRKGKKEKVLQRSASESELL